MKGETWGLENWGKFSKQEGLKANKGRLASEDEWSLACGWGNVQVCHAVARHRELLGTDWAPLTMSRKCLSGSYPDTSSLQSEMEVIRQLFLSLLSLNPMWKMGRSRSHSSSVGKDIRGAVPSIFHWMTKSHKLGQPRDLPAAGRCWKHKHFQKMMLEVLMASGNWRHLCWLVSIHTACVTDLSHLSLPPHMLPGGCGPTPNLLYGKDWITL